MTGLAEPGMEVWLSKSDNPKRKLAWSWELVRVGRRPGRRQRGASQPPGGGSARRRGDPRARRLPDGAARGALRHQLAGRFPAARRRRPAACYVEIKNVHLKRGEPGRIPRFRHRARHQAPGRAGAHGRRTAPRRSCSTWCSAPTAGRFSVAGDIDPAYAAALATARAAGSRLLCYTCRIRRRASTWTSRCRSLFNGHPSCGCI